MAAMLGLVRDSLLGAVHGPIILSAYFVAVYGYLSVGCILRWDHTALAGIDLVTLGLLLISALALAFIVFGALLSARVWRLAHARLVEGDDDREERRRFTGRLGVMLSALSLVSLAWIALPVMLQRPPCW
jgi:hypothetical protein